MITRGTIVALAWPDTKVVKEGKWYDVPMAWMGFIKEGYYKAGHAAMLLIDHDTAEVHYFDYGRYHTPYQYGRVRDKETDPDIAVKQQAIIDNGEVMNIEALLHERYANKACHGDGRLTASVLKDVCFVKAYQKAKAMQHREAIPYGPFAYKGSTCSRLVVQVAYEATTDRLTRFLIRFPYTISATPRSNNKVLNDEAYYYEVVNGEIVKRKNKLYPLKHLFKKKTSIVSYPQRWVPGQI